VLFQLLAITRNTFLESIRQPIMLVLLVVATLGLIFSNALSAYTMENDQRMMIDMGLSTIFVCGTLIAAFIATNVLTLEIENKTALTVISKPVGRPLFVIGKFLGVALAIALATAYMTFVFLLVEMHGTMQTVRDPWHGPVLLFGIGAALLGLLAALWCNYFYNMVFASTAIAVTTPLMALAYVLAMMFDAHFTPQAMAASFEPNLWLALIPLLMAILVLTAVAVAASTRLTQVMTVIITIGVFLLGMLSDHFIGRPIDSLNKTWLSRAQQEGLAQPVEVVKTIALTSGETEEVRESRLVASVPLWSLATGPEKFEFAAWWTCYAVVPNFQVFWLSDAVTQNHRIPPEYVGRALTYGGLYIVVALSVGIIMFQRREVG
jgi:hypothetical protein